MKPRPACLLLLLSFIGLVVADVPVAPVKNPFAGDPWVLPVAQPALKAGPGVEGISGTCALCHSLDYILTQPPLSRAQWTAAVEKMRAKFGAPLMTNQTPVLVDYLTANYGRENPVK
jgi:hypothetical protein